jgi:hypothetical protein
MPKVYRSQLKDILVVKAETDIRKIVYLFLYSLVMNFL